MSLMTCRWVSHEGTGLMLPYLTTPLPPHSSLISYISSHPSTTINTNPFTPSPSCASQVSLLAFILFANHSLLFLIFSAASSSSSSSSYPVFHSVVLRHKTTTQIVPLLFSHILLVSYLFYHWIGLTLNWNDFSPSENKAYHLISSIPLLPLPAELHNSLYCLHPSTHTDLSHLLLYSSSTPPSQHYTHSFYAADTTADWPSSGQTSSIKCTITLKPA